MIDYVGSLGRIPLKGCLIFTRIALVRMTNQYNKTPNSLIRNQSVEVLRIVLMTLIVFGHFLTFGNHFQHTNTDGTLTSLGWMQPLFLYHVDTFVFISGYYGINLKWKKFVFLILKMTIYSCFAIFLALCLTNEFKLSVSSCFNNIYPISTCDWWFMASYLFLMLMSPLINAGMEAASFKQSVTLICVMYIVSFRTEYSLLLFIYILGRHFRRFPCCWLEKNAGKVFVSVVVMFFVLNYVLLQNGIYIKKLYEYMSPFVIISAVALFYVFKRINIKIQYIGNIASGVLAAYLITTHDLPRQAFNNLFYEMVSGNVFELIVISILIVIVCSLIDLVTTKMLNFVLFVCKQPNVGCFNK